MASPTINVAQQSSSVLSKKRSMIWSYYKESGEKQANCDLCGTKVSTAGNTTNLTKVLYNVLYNKYYHH